MTGYQTSARSRPDLVCVLTEVTKALRKHSETPGLDAQVLLSQVCSRSRSWLLAHPEYTLSSDESLKLANGLAQLAAGVPLPYVVGEWDFFGLTFSINPNVLIPRPETELLVETALKWLEAHPEKRMAADIGTGSGCIAISLAVSVPDLQITAVDLSPEAVRITEQNVQRHYVGKQVEIFEGDLMADLSGPFDLICANLPYIPSDTLHGLDVYLREPTLALDGGKDGLDLIGAMLFQAADRLTPGGLILVEIEAGQGGSAQILALTQFFAAKAEILHDLAGQPRLLTIQT